MTTPKLIKFVLALGMSCTLLSCDSSGDVDDAQVQVQAYLGLAEVYKGQGQFRASVIETQNAFELMPQNVDTLAFIAGLYLEIGDVTLAIEQLDAALAILPDSNRLKLLLGEAYLASNRTQEGQALVEPLQVTGEELVQKKWLLGSFQAVAGNNQAAEATFRDILSTDSDHVPTLIALAKITYLNGDTATANTLTEQAADVASPDNVDLWIWRGQLAMLQEDYPAAESAFFEALDIMALYDIMTAKRFATLNSILLPLQMQQKNDEALRYSQIIAATPQGEFSSSYSNVLSLFEQGSMAEAEEALGDLLANSPNHPGSNILMGIAKYSAGDFQEAERLLGEYVDPNTASPQLITTLASTHLRMNQPERALSVLQDALVNNAGNTSIMMMIGIIQRGLGNTEQSIATLNEAVALAPDSAELHVALAGSYIQLEDFDTAIAQLNSAIAIAPEMNAAKSALLDVYTRQQDPEAAQATVQEWLSAQPDSYFNNMAAALIAMSTQSFDTARTYLNQALTLEPGNIQAQLFLARVDVQEERFADAELKFNAVLEQEIGNADALSGILALGDLAGNPQTTLARVQQIVTDNPTEFVPPLVLSQYYLVNNTLDSSLEYAEKAYAVTENVYTTSMLAEVSSRQAVLALQQQDIDRARTMVARAEEIQPENIQALLVRAGIEIQAQNFTEAQNYIDKIRALQPDNAYTYELEGDVYLARGDNGGAMTAYNTAWEKQLAPGLGLKIFQLHVSQGQPDAALAFLDDWIALDSQDIAPKLLLAMDLQTKEENDQAIAYYEQAYAIDPDNLVMLNNLAWLYQDSQPERALELASHAAELYPQNSDVLDTYGWILHKQNERDQAIAILEQAAELAPDNQGIQEHLNTARQ